MKDDEVARDMASPDWLCDRRLSVFARKVLLKINQFVTVLVRRARTCQTGTLLPAWLLVGIVMY